MNYWYELEILELNNNNNKAYYPIVQLNRSDSNAGFDLYNSETIMIEKGKCSFVSFGVGVRMLKVEVMPNGQSHEYLKSDSHFWLLPRSSIYKSNVIMANSMGVIDKSYRGELKAPVWSMEDTTLSEGDRLFQIVAPDMGWIRNVRIVLELPETERGRNGFGSSGK